MKRIFQYQIIKILLYLFRELCLSKCQQYDEDYDEEFDHELKLVNVKGLDCNWDSFNKTELYIIEASNNTITVISNVTILEDLPNLRRFIMSHNPDYEFPVNSVFLSHANLEEVIIKSCNIKDIYKETFSKLTNLGYLSLSDNRQKFKFKRFMA